MLVWQVFQTLMVSLFPKSGVLRFGLCMEKFLSVVQEPLTAAYSCILLYAAETLDVQKLISVYR
jgi:hypothetical protein